MRTIDFVVPDVHGRVGIQGHSTRSRSVRADANATHIWASFASRRTCRSLCAAPLGLGGNAYFGRTVRNGGSASICVGPLEGISIGAKKAEKNLK
jgi:hypothetical protein